MLAAQHYWQIAWVVDDLDLAIKQWQETTRIGPFFKGDHVGGIFVDARYRGNPTEIDISCAIAQAGPVQIELITQHDGAPSPYRDVYAEGLGGIHHVCTFVEDLDAECTHYQRNGFEVVLTSLVGGQTPVGYVDTRSMTGCMTELMVRGDLVSQINDTVAAAAADWDGTDPVRDMTSLLT